MKRRARASLSIIIVCFVMLLSMAAISSAAIINWSNGALPVDGDWNNTANWTGGIKPNATSDSAKVLMATGPVFSTGRTATAFKVYLDGTNGSITMDGGTLNTNNFFGIGYTAATDSGTLTVNSGTITIAAGTLNNLLCGVKGTGTINMSGGAINLPGSTFFIARDAGSTGTVNLSGGTITCGTLSMRANNATANGTINITGSGKLIFTSSALPVATYIANGWIKAYNGAGSVVVDTTTTPGKTIVTGLISYKATIPRPSSGATGMVSNGTTLSWTPGVSAVSHDVYLGTSLADVNNAQRFAGDIDGSGVVDFKDVSRLTEYWLLDPAGTEPYVGVNTDNTVDFFDYAMLAQDWANSAGAVFRGNQDANSFNPGTLAFGTKYYWRIDEVSGPNTAKGDVWSFTINSGKAAAVTPAGGATNVLSRAVLAWTPDPGATSHDIYFGTTNPPPFIGNQSAAIYNPGGSMANSTTYYWRIDEKYSVGTVQGDVWSFTTIDAASEPDLVFVQASDPELGWSGCTPSRDYLWGVTVSKVNNINANFMLVTGDLVSNDNYVAAYKSYKAALSPAIGCFEVPGNTDLGGTGSLSEYAAWASNYGYGPNPWYSFVYGNNIFIGLDSLVLITPFDGKDVEEINWLTHTLADADANGVNHKFVFMHHPLFLRDVNEPATVAFPAARRNELRTIFHTYHVNAVFSGHYHTDACVLDGDLEYITSPACTCSYGPAAIRIIKVYSDRIEHEVRNLDTLP